MDHILQHNYVLKSDSWLMPLVIILVIVIFAISHMTFIIIVEKYNQIINIYWLMKCKHMIKHNKTMLTIYLPIY